MRTKLFCTVITFTLISVTLNAQQYWNVFGGNTLLGAEYIGANGTSIFPLELKTIPPLSINFYTNNLQRATILGNGRVGIGINNPLWQLDVADEINISQPRNYYMIGGETVLHNAGTENIFTGVNCGKDILAGSASGNMNVFNGYSAGEFASGNDNVFIGHSTGRYSKGRSNIFIGSSAGMDNLGDYNSIVGFTAGMYLTTGIENTFMGLRSGECNTTGSYNTFYGSRAGIGQNPSTPIVGRNNSFFGYASGQAIKDGNDNIFAGSHSGNSNSSGSYNTFIGGNAGYNNEKGTYNTYIGNNAGSPVSYNLHYASAIGTNATVMNDKVMILGDNDINVGIGMSGVLGGPLTKLQILSSLNVPQFRISYDYGNNIHTDFQTTASGDLKINPTGHFTGFDLSVSPANVVDINSSSSAISGLRLRNLSTTSNSNGKVLSVDNSGDVILVNDIGGGTVNSNCNIQDIVALFDNTGNMLQCSDIYNNAASTPNNRIGFFTNAPQYKFQMEGTSLFTLNQIVAPLGLTTHAQANNPVMMIESRNQEGLSILHSSTTGVNIRDLMKVYGDDDKLYHIRTVSDAPIMNNVYPGSLSIDHEDNAGTIRSFVGFNNLRKSVVMKDNFNISPDVNAPLSINMISARYSKLVVEAQSKVLNNDQVYAITGINSNADNTIPYAVGVYGVSETQRSQNNNIIANIGGYFYATGSANTNISMRPARNFGLQGVAHAPNNNSDNRAGFFHTYGIGTVNYGLFSLCSGGSTNYALYARVPRNTCASGPSTGCTSAAGFFDGSVYTTNNYYHTSDSTLKQNIVLAPQSDTLLNNLSVYKFNYDTLNNYGLSLEGGTHYGVIAQEVQQVLPQLVKNFLQPAEYDSSGVQISQQKDILAVNYTEFIPLLIAGYKQQSNLNDTLSQQLQTLQSRLDSLIIAVGNCCNAQFNSTKNSPASLTVELNNMQAIVLNQNEPNPFAENTTISWNIPPQQEPLNAMLVFYNTDGSILKMVKIPQTGEGSLLVYGNNLSSGQYSYSLVVNNATIKTKQMVKVK